MSPPPAPATGKINLLEHPVIETFFELKWWKIWKVYSFFMVLFLCHTLSTCGYALMEWGHVCSPEQRVSLPVAVPSNAHISTPFFQKTVFFSKICFGNPPS
jgi:hypothetical protein